MTMQRDKDWRMDILIRQCEIMAQNTANRALLIRILSTVSDMPEAAVHDLASTVARDTLSELLAELQRDYPPPSERD